MGHPRLPTHHPPRRRWRDRTHTDTLIQKDTIQVPYPVEKPLTTWQRFCLDYGKITTGATVALILLLALRIFGPRKK